MDLDRPDRFLNVLLRPQWNSWLGKGGYTISLFGLLVTIWGAAILFGWNIPEMPLLWVTAFFAIILTIYTAFLFAQAKGRDFWQSPTLPIHMLVHTVMAGTAIFSIVMFITGFEDWMVILKNTMVVAIAVNLLTLLFELTITHPTTSAKTVVKMITKGEYKWSFWLLIILLGNIVPLILLFVIPSAVTIVLISLLVLMGIYDTEKIWIEAPQRIPLA
jgi:formate-dependent nitrite reductase membrane component NrfD